MTGRGRAIERVDPAIRAAIEFLALIDAATGQHIFVNALHRHRSGSYGLCVLHRERWPCAQYRLAVAARDLVASRPPHPLPIPRQRSAPRELPTDAPRA